MSPAPKLIPILAAIALGLSACATSVPGAVSDARTPTEQFKAEIKSVPAEIRLAVHAQGLSTNQAAALAGFVAAWREAEGGKITLRSPRGRVDGAAAYRTTEGARTLLIAQGVPAAAIETVGYEPATPAEAVLWVGYSAYVAVVPKCGQTWTNLSHNFANQPQPNFGCAVTANVAAQIANPGDLAVARDMASSDAGRRDQIITRYRAGEHTSSEQDKQADGAVSKAVN